MLKKALLAGAALTCLPLTALAERGADGDLKILYWQAASTLNPYLSGIAKEVDAAALVVEPLARFDPEGTLVPVLAAEIPTHENGGISEDMTRITWKLKPGVTWSDGSALRADDVVFTWTYCTAEGAGCAASNAFDGVSDVVALDPQTVQVTFAQPTPYPYVPFVSSTVPILQQAQFKDCMGERIVTCTDQNFGPIGTGPFMVSEFRPNDVVTFVANPAYRDPGKPHFATVTIKGGGDAMASARAVFETGEADYAWNLQLAPDVMAHLLDQGRGVPAASFGSWVEYLFVNMTDPSADLGAERSTAAGGVHPILGDIRVRKALSLAIDRGVMAEVLYGEQGRVTCNIVPAPAQYVSTANDACVTPDIEGAKALLDEAGWTDSDGDGIRDKDGKKLEFSFLTTTSGVRQDEQAMLKHWWTEIGMAVNLRNVAGSVFFGGDAGNPDTRQKFYADLEMYTDNSKGLDQETFLNKWTCKAVPSPETQWQGPNVSRFCSPEYDALAEKFRSTDTIGARAALAREMNDMLVQSYAMIPLVHRGGVSGASVTLEGVQMNSWDSELWNVADWSRAK
ncbi:MAG: peptide ABC transporter substrate-binding protein [Qingshengfaniella sp.]